MKYIALLVVVLLISGCNNALTGNVASDHDLYETGIGIGVYFCPEDDCDKIIETVVDNAEISVHCAFFDLDLKDLIKKIAAKSYNADVKVIVDDGNYDGQIKGEGIRVAKSKQYMHNKFCIIDKNMVLTGSMNPTDNGANLNNNNMVFIESKYIAENYENEFNELWNGIYASGDNVKYDKIDTDIGQIENYFCPEDCTLESWGINKIINLVNNAEKSVKVAIFSFTHEELADELVKADIRGVDVKVLVERKQRNVQNSQYSRLKDFGVNIKVDGNKYNMHHKFIVIDDSIVITGSPNFSFSGFNRNDENMLIMYNEDVALRFVNEFDRLFSEGEVINI
ncbi:MAG: phospholipase D-like domain-containing protein [Candidatus Woesearchaeota archaeon]